MKRTMILLLLLALPAGLHAAGTRRDSLLVMFWNVENFFDWRSGNGPEYWTRGRFYRKCDAVSKTILRVADLCGRLPDAVGFAEVENEYVLRQLLSSTLLRKLDYSIVHFESPDHRGIDCALLYRRSSLKLLRSHPAHIRDSSGAVLPTRDILVAEFDRLAVLVNHHPSKVGDSGEKADRRALAMATMQSLCDSLQAAGTGRILCVGDFNEDVWGDRSRGNFPGTIKYNGRWEKIDGCFARGDAEIREEICAIPELLTEDRAFGGRKPLRTFSGPRWLGGASDHLPIAVTIFFDTFVDTEKH